MLKCKKYMLMIRSNILKNKGKYLSILLSAYIVISIILIPYLIYDCITSYIYRHNVNTSMDIYDRYVFINALIPYHDTLTELSKSIISNEDDDKIENLFKDLQNLSSNIFYRFSIFPDDINKDLEKIIFDADNSDKAHIFKEILNLDNKYPKAFDRTQMVEVLDYKSDVQNDLSNYCEDLLQLLK